MAPEVLKGERRVSAQRRKLKVPKSWKPHVSNVQDPVFDDRVIESMGDRLCHGQI